MRTSVIVAVLCPLVAAQTSTHFAFSTPSNENEQQGKLVKRQRRAKVGVQHASKESEKARHLSGEEKEFWGRFLAEEMSVAKPTPANPPPVAAPVAPPVSAPVAAPVAAPVEVEAPVAAPVPSPCPVTVQVECVKVDGSSKCEDITFNAQSCIVEVEYSYLFTNSGSEIERIYSLEITRGGVTTDIISTFEITDIAPGGQAYILEKAEIDFCDDDTSVFETSAAFVTGPPCDVEVSISCESEAGDECRSLPQAPTPDDCLIDITYTYTVTNVGDVDANIILFTRTRNDEFKDLIDLLPTTSLAVSESTVVEESEEIDRCVQQSFATNTVVAQIPSPDLLCEDVGFYP